MSPIVFVVTAVLMRALQKGGFSCGASPGEDRGPEGVAVPRSEPDNEHLGGIALGCRLPKSLSPYWLALPQDLLPLHPCGDLKGVVNAKHARNRIRPHPSESEIHIGVHHTR